MQGSDYSVVCEVTGTPYPRINWTMHYDTFKSNVHQEGNTLHIYNAQPHNRGIYVCVATNDAGQDESNMRIDVEPREMPVIEIYPTEPQKINIGDSATLSCRAISGQPTPILKWTRRDHRPISSRFREEYEGTLTLLNAELEDAGEYICTAENIAGRVTATTSIEMSSRPIIRLDPDTERISVTEGEELKMDCHGEGIPLPTTSWETPKRNGILPINRSPYRPVDHSTATVYIEKVTRSDAGYYTCTATNAGGSEVKYVEVDVKPLRGDLGPGGDDHHYPPDHSDNGHGSGLPPVTHPTKLKPYIISNGDRAKLTCEIKGIDRPAYPTWQRADGKGLPYSAKVEGSNLIIERTTHEAAGIYECLISDNYGKLIAIITAEIVVTG